MNGRELWTFVGEYHKLLLERVRAYATLGSQLCARKTSGTSTSWTQRTTVQSTPPLRFPQLRIDHQKKRILRFESPLPRPSELMLKSPQTKTFPCPVASRNRDLHQ